MSNFEKKIEKAVKLLVLPKFPFIKDFVVVKHDTEEYPSWGVTLYSNYDELDKSGMYRMIVKANVLGEMQSITRNILNLRLYQLLVNFESIKNKPEEDLPFDEKIEEGYRERTFNESLDEMDLKWHWDEQDRLVSPTHKTDWMFQFDNELPIRLKEGEEIFIPKGRYHRVIKGTGDLKVKVKFL